MLSPCSVEMTLHSSVSFGKFEKSESGNVEVFSWQTLFIVTILRVVAFMHSFSCYCFVLLWFSVIEEKGVRLKLTITDTPGFGDQINNESWYDYNIIIVYLCERCKLLCSHSNSDLYHVFAKKSSSILLLIYIKSFYQWY